MEKYLPFTSRWRVIHDTHIQDMNTDTLIKEIVNQGDALLDGSRDAIQLGHNKCIS